MKQRDEIVEGIVRFYIGSIVSSTKRLIFFIRKIRGNLFGRHPGEINHQGLAASAIMALLTRIFSLKGLITGLSYFDNGTHNYDLCYVEF